MLKTKLNNGIHIPVIGLGTWQVKSNPGQVESAVKDAIDLGYRHFDCAAIYKNECEVGSALRAKMEDGSVKREELFITSKIWNTSHTRASVPVALKKTIANLGLAYLDLYLIHWPMGYKEDGNDEWFPIDNSNNVIYTDVDYTETWTGMEDCVKEGLVKSIGVSNFSAPQLKKILENCSIPPANNQVECHPYLPQVKLLAFCQEKGISLTAYSPLGSPDRPWMKTEEPVLMEDSKLKIIADKYKKAPAQILIKFQVQRGVICIPKSVTKARIEANMQVFDFELTGDEMKVLSSFDYSMRYCPATEAISHSLYPFNTEF